MGADYIKWEPYPWHFEAFNARIYSLKSGECWIYIPIAKLHYSMVYSNALMISGERHQPCAVLPLGSCASLLARGLWPRQQGSTCTSPGLVHRSYHSSYEQTPRCRKQK